MCHLKEHFDSVLLARLMTNEHKEDKLASLKKNNNKTTLFLSSNMHIQAILKFIQALLKQDLQKD